MSTLIVASLFLGLLLAQILLGALCLRVGLRWAKVPHVAMSRVTFAAILVVLLQTALNFVPYRVSPAAPALALLFAIGELIAAVLIACCVIMWVFKTPFLRALQAWLPTLAAPVVTVAIVILVVRPFLVEAFTCSTNSMAPTLLGRHWRGTCVECLESRCVPATLWDLGRHWRGTCVECGNPAFGSPVLRQHVLADTPFRQEYHVPYAIDPGGPGNDVRAIVVDKTGSVWAATKAGVRVLRDQRWTAQPGVTEGPTYDLFADNDGTIWVGAWDGVYRIAGSEAAKVDGVDGPVAVVGTVPGRMVALGPDGAWQSAGHRWSPVEDRWSRNVRDSAVDANGDWWIATGMGLYRVSQNGVRHYYRPEEVITGDLNAVTLAPDGQLWIGGPGGIDVYENGKRVAFFTSRKYPVGREPGLSQAVLALAKEPLPNFDVRSLSFAPDGRLWAGTALGVARYTGNGWSLRHSRRWLLSDDVRDVAFDREGTAWVATGSGVSAIKHCTMTLAQKADHYLEICLKRHVRPPYLVEKCFFPDPNNREVFEPRDDDNDGQYTAMYLAMESLRYAVTRDPGAKANADKAYEALEFLQTVTGTRGFVARTVVPSSWSRMADPNERLSPQERVERRVRDPRYKSVDERWRLSADGKWLWKGDTSSDEITGHMFGYVFYYDLAADDAHRQRLRQHVRNIMDCIIEGGYTLRDLDGTHTRWGVWSPEKLNKDPDWRVEQKINAFEILSFLKATYHMTGDEKYQTAYLDLIRNHGYAEIVRRPKAYGLSERTHIDDELMALAAPGLLWYEKDPQLRAVYLEGYEWAYRTVENEQDPFFNFVFALVGGNGFHLEQSVAFLRDQPLDLVQWTVNNASREDLELVRWPMMEPLQTDRMLPASERGVMRWDKNPWSGMSGDFCDERGSLESCGVFWLLPYWMARYAGLIQPPQ